ncbi:TBC1 domain, member 5 [Apophysomyces sp. BC1034]|nr:TBC1 domain, member 5 [Apophysomyces sp. BC1034]
MSTGSANSVLEVSQVFLGYLPTLDVSSWPAIHVQHRQRYADLKRVYIDEPAEKMLKKGESQEDLSDNNPLALNESNPWQQYFADIELRKVILQDVERTFPDVDYFRSEMVQQHMTDILFIYCKLHQNVSYRQGMHELLAPLYLITATESLGLAESDDLTNITDPVTKIMVQTLDSAYVEHDAYILFDSLMKSAKPWYEFNESVPRPIQAQNSRLNPVVSACLRVHNQYLRKIDPVLYKHLESLGIEPQLYGIRWLRLLFGREFDIDNLLKLWDAIFAEDATLSIVEFICLSILLRMRDQLLENGYAECLSLLMRPLHMEHPATLVEQAKYLQGHIIEDAALHILRQNDIRAGKEPRTSLWDGVDINRYSQIASNRLRHRQSHGTNLDSFTNITRGMMKSPQVQELNKAIAGMMDSVQKNVSIFGSSFDVPSNTSRRRLTVPSEFPADIDRIASTGSFHKYDSHSRGESASQRTSKGVSETSEVLRLRSINRQMGSLVAKCVDVLEKELFPTPEISTNPSTAEGVNQQDEKVENSDVSLPSENTETESITADDAPAIATTSHDEKSEKKLDEASLIIALVGLKHVRDVLTGRQTEFDPSVVDMEYNISIERPDKVESHPIGHYEVVEEKIQTPLSPALDKPLPPLQTEPVKPALSTRYIPANPAPRKPPVKYRIEDILSDPALQSPTTKSQQNARLQWMLNSDDQLEPGAGTTTTRKRMSCSSKRSETNLLATTIVPTASSDSGTDPLDAKNVDNRKAYEYDTF